MCTAQNGSVRALFATAQQPQSRNIFLNQKILPLNKLINHQEGIFVYKVINDAYLLDNILTDRHDLHHYQLRNAENWRIPLHSTTVNYLFVVDLSKLGIVYLTIYVAHLPSLVLGENWNYCSISNRYLLNDIQDRIKM